MSQRQRTFVYNPNLPTAHESKAARIRACARHLRKGKDRRWLKIAKRATDAEVDEALAMIGMKSK